jgi:hypothetical protein
MLAMAATRGADDPSVKGQMRTGIQTAKTTDIDSGLKGGCEMRNLTALLAILVPLAITPAAITPAAADYVPIDTETLDGWCQPYGAGTSGSQARCDGYINSVAGTLARGVPVNGHRACIPNNVPLFYLRVVTVSALGNHAEDGYTNARGWVARVLSEAFPC